MGSGTASSRCRWPHVHRVSAQGPTTRALLFISCSEAGGQSMSADDKPKQATRTPQLGKSGVESVSEWQSCCSCLALTGMVTQQASCSEICVCVCTVCAHAFEREFMYRATQKHREVSHGFIRAQTKSLESITFKLFCCQLPNTPFVCVFLCSCFCHLIFLKHYHTRFSSCCPLFILLTFSLTLTGGVCKVSVATKMCVRFCRSPIKLRLCVIHKIINQEVYRLQYPWGYGWERGGSIGQ